MNLIFYPHLKRKEMRKYMSLHLYFDIYFLIFLNLFVLVDLCRDDIGIWVFIMGVFDLCVK